MPTRAVPDAPGGPARTAPIAVRLDRVSRRFPARRAGQSGEILALDAVSLEVPAGTIVGILGPNGAGKTTLLRLLCGLLPPSAGRIEVLGGDPAQHPAQVRRGLGVVLGGERSMYWRLTGRENLLYAAALYGMPSRAARQRAAEALRLVGLEDRADDLVEQYSTGMRQRLALARALVHDPPLLLLDEPVAGLDPHAVAAMRQLFDRLRTDRGRTVILATHNLADAERLCERVAILDRGRLVAYDAPEALAAQVAARTQHLRAPTALERAFFALTGSTLAAERAEGEQ